MMQCSDDAGGQQRRLQPTQPCFLATSYLFIMSSSAAAAVEAVL